MRMKLLKISSKHGEKTTRERTTRHQFEKFSFGDLSPEDEKGRGRSSLIDNYQLISIIEIDSRKTITEIIKWTFQQYLPFKKTL